MEINLRTHGSAADDKFAEHRLLSVRYLDMDKFVHMSTKNTTMVSDEMTAGHEISSLKLRIKLWRPEYTEVKVIVRC